MARDEAATSLEDAVARILQAFTDDQGAPRSQLIPAEAIAIADVMATLALGQRVAAAAVRLERALGDSFGDDSYLDRIAREVRDGLDAIRVDGVGVG
jgi:hypothetical protein